MNVFLYNLRSTQYQNDWAIERSSFWCDKSNVDRYFNDNKLVVEDYVAKFTAGNPQLPVFR